MGGRSSIHKKRRENLSGGTSFTVNLCTIHAIVFEKGSKDNGFSATVIIVENVLK